MKKIDTNPLYQSISFWICVGLFIYFTGNFFVTIVIPSLILPSAAPEVKAQVFMIYKIILVVKNLILAFSLFGKNFYEADKPDEFKLPDDIVLDEFKLSNLQNPKRPQTDVFPPDTE